MNEWIGAITSTDTQLVITQTDRFKINRQDEQMLESPRGQILHTDLPQMHLMNSRKYIKSQNKPVVL